MLSGRATDKVLQEKISDLDRAIDCFRYFKHTTLCACYKTRLPCLNFYTVWEAHLVSIIPCWHRLTTLSDGDYRWFSTWSSLINMVNGHKPPYRSRWRVLEWGVLACWHLQPFWPRLQPHSRSKRPFFGSTQGAEDSAVSSATKIWTAQAQSATLVEAMRHIHKARYTPMAAKVFEKFLTDDPNTQTDTAKFRAAATPHAGDWLHAPPIMAVRWSNSHRSWISSWKPNLPAT